MPFTGSYSVKQSRALLIYFDENNEYITEKLDFSEPGLALITFHPVEIVPGEDEPEERIVEDVLRAIPPIEVFAVYEVENGVPQEHPMLPFEQNVDDMYQISWVHDYLFVINRAPFEWFDQQHQWSRRSAQGANVGQVQQGDEADDEQFDESESEGEEEDVDMDMNGDEEEEEEELE